MTDTEHPVQTPMIVMEPVRRLHADDDHDDVDHIVLLMTEPHVGSRVLMRVMLQFDQAASADDPIAPLLIRHVVTEDGRLWTIVESQEEIGGNWWIYPDHHLSPERVGAEHIGRQHRIDEENVAYEVHRRNWLVSQDLVPRAPINPQSLDPAMPTGLQDAQSRIRDLEATIADLQTRLEVAEYRGD